MTPAARNTALPEFAALLAILAAVVFCAWPGMRAPLFSDDIYQLELAKHFRHWTEIFQPDVFQLYRPVKNLIFMLAAPLEGNLPAWHWIGLVAYLAATLGVFRIAEICLGSRRPALLATAVWALSPTCVSTVLWLSCANISIGLFLAAGAFHFHELAATRRKPGWLVGALVCYALALLCYESLIVVPALLFLRDLQHKRLAPGKAAALRLGLYVLVAAAFLIVRHEFSAKSIGAGEFHAGFAPDTTPVRLMLSAPWFFWRHFLMWIMPVGTIEILGSYQWLRSVSPLVLVLSCFFLLGWIVAAALAWKHLPVVAYGLLFFLVASLPSGNFLPCFNGPINDAYLTIPSVGLALIFAHVCGILAAECRRRRDEASSGVLALAALIGIFLFYRIPACGAYFRYWAGVWQNPTKLVLLMTESRPLQFQLKGFTSMALLADGYLEPAEELANEALHDAPWNQLAIVTLARIADFRKDATAAEQLFRSILDSPRIDVPLLNNTRYELATIIAADPRRREEAAAFCRQILKSSPGGQRIPAALLLARIYVNQGLPDKARATLTRGLELYPGHADIAALLAAIEKGDPLPLGQPTIDAPLPD